MPRNPRMRARAELIAALRHARNRQAAEESAMHSAAPDSMDLERARHYAAVWGGEINAYRFALRVEPNYPDPLE